MSMNFEDLIKEHAALRAWCLLMNAYRENASSQQKSKLLKEWQDAERCASQINNTLPER